MTAGAEGEMRSRLEQEMALGQARLYTDLGEKVLGGQQLPENKSGIRGDNKSGSVFLPFCFCKGPGFTAGNVLCLDRSGNQEKRMQE